MEAKVLMSQASVYLPTTLCFITTANRILLGHKKRGLGEGFWNGFGGKVDQAKGEGIQAAALRELEEEAGIFGKDLCLQAKLYFSFDGSEQITETFVFHSQNYSGQPRETEEMRPQWFELADIPYEKMWADDVLWLPLFLQGHSLSAYFHFDARQRMAHGRLRSLPAQYFTIK